MAADKYSWAKKYFQRLVLACCAVAGLAWAAPGRPDPVQVLRAHYAALGEQLQNNQFGRPLALESSETPSRLTGDIHAVVDYPFALVSAGLNDPGHWCDVMSLPVNTKYCRPEAGPAGTTLKVYVGKKTAGELADASRVNFAYRVLAAAPEYFDIALNAAEGPMGTSDYRIELEAVALPNGKTFLHLTYSYAFNFAGRLAMQTYLATLARDKVGFTAAGNRANGGPPAYVGGMRALVERNAMRYYLAIDAFLESTGAAPAAQLERRLQTWFAATEQYPRQLHEVDRAEYLKMKRAESLRQQSLN